MVGTVVQPIVVFHDAIASYWCLDEELGLRFGLYASAIAQLIDDTMQAIGEVSHVQVAMEYAIAHAASLGVVFCTVNCIDQLQIVHLLGGGDAQEERVVIAGLRSRGCHHPHLYAVESVG